MTSSAIAYSKPSAIRSQPDEYGIQATDVIWLLIGVVELVGVVELIGVDR